MSSAMLQVTTPSDREIAMTRVFNAPRRLVFDAMTREIAAPERLVSTEVFDNPWYAGEGLATGVLVEQGGKTTLTHTMRYDSREVRDKVLKSGMEKGVAVSYDRLAGIVEAERGEE